MWKTVKLGDVLKTSAGGTPLKSRKEFYENGNVAWLLSGEVCAKEITSSSNFITENGLKNSSAKIFPSDTVLVAMYGATAGQVGILRFDCATNQAVCGIYPSEKYLPEFLYYYLTSYKETLLEQVSGVAQPNLSQEKIKSVPLPIIGLSEQQRIVEKLDRAFEEIDRAIEATKLKQEEVKALKSAMLSDELNSSELAKTIKLGDVCKIVNGSTPSRREDSYWDGEMNWFTIDDMRREGRDIYSTVQTVTQKALKETSLKVLPANTVLLCCTASVGEVAISRVEMATNQQFNGLIPITSLVTTDFLYYVSSTLKDKLLSVSGSTTINFVSIGKLKDILINIPPLAEQVKIVEKLDQVFKSADEVLESFSKQLGSYKQLKSAILAQELKGPES